ncbi:MAG: formylmethanofuran dehydrogenase, partial [Dongiaceae bacterium]
MTDAEFDRKLEEAARLLSASALPVVGGLATDLAGSVAAFRLVGKLGGAVDHAAAAWSLRDQAVLH